MTNKHRFATLRGLLSASILLASAAQAQDQQPQEEGLGDIVVTAQRRSESLQRTAVSVTAIDAAALDRQQITDTKQIVFNAPNLTGNNNVGQNTATTFFIRGVGTTENLATADTSVGLYVDDVYISRQAVNNFSLFDVERIEVLRGPQGTLYGRNTNGGAIKIVPKAPDAKTAFALSGSYGNYDRWEGRLSANVPLSDRIFVRANLLVQQGDGYIYNRTLDKKVNDQDYAGGRIAVRALLTDSLTFDYAFDYGRDKTNGGYASDIAGSLRPSTGDLFTVVSGTDASGYARGMGHSGKLSWDVNDDLSVESITAWRSTKQNLLLDLSDQPIPLYVLDQKQLAKQFSEEIKVNATLSDALKLTAGFFYFDENIDADVTDTTRSAPTAAPSIFRKVFEVDVNSWAAFGQLEYAVLDSVKLVAAGRYTHEKRELTVTQTSNLAGPLFNFTTADLLTRAAAGQDFDNKRSFNKFTPKIGIDWTVNDDLFAYASWTKGFRSGGWTGRALRADQYINFDPEEVESWEAGTKVSLFDRKVRWNSSIFYMNYSNLFNTLTVNGAFTAQLADARIYGLESELTIRAAPWLDLFSNVGLLNGRYKGNRPANLADKLQRAPSFQGKAGFSVNKPLGAGTLLVNGDVFYTAHYLVTPANLAFTAPLVPVNSNRSGDFALVNGSIGYRWGADDNYQLTLSCSNCFNREYFDAQTVIGRYAAAYAGAPRFYKLTGSVKF